MMTTRRYLLLFATAGLVLFGSHVHAQVLPPGVDSATIARRLQQSGLTRDQLQDRLRRAGYDPSLADSYFGGTQGGRTPGGGGATDPAMLEALYNIGIDLSPQVTSEDSAAVTRPPLPEEEASPAPEPEVFGRDVFRRETTQFTSALTGPVSPDYRLGPGDQIILLLSGDVEQIYTLGVSREGTILVPDVGQISVNGLTLAQLEDQLYVRLGRVFSGVRRGPDATTHFQVSLARLRTNLIRVVGEVRRPGAYQVSSVATLLEALYLAGGPTDVGSYRRVMLRRGGELVTTFDLYPYLTAGETEGDVRLEQGDVVFVPVVGAQVTAVGTVRREAIFELLGGEGLPELLRYAGGLLPGTRVDRAQVDRVLPGSERGTGVDRVLLDVPLFETLAGTQPFELLPGDRIEFFEVLRDRRNRVEINGAVWRPGTYELRAGSTASSLIERAGGLVDDALEAKVQVVRLDPTDGTRALLDVNLATDGDLPLREFDEVRVFGLDSLLVPDSVAIYGLVQKPGRYPLAEGTTAEDLLLRAGGFRRGAVPWEAEVVRFERDVRAEREIAASRKVGLSPGLPYPDSGVVALRPPGADSLPAAETLPLADGDEVYIRRLPQFRDPQRVVVEGEVAAPGAYVLLSQDETVSSVLRRAGGITPAANPEGLRLFRDGILVGVDYQRATSNPRGADDPILRDGDRIQLPVRDQTVLVRGAVVFESRVAYRAGMDFDAFIRQAGGYAPDADVDRASVEYANGERAAVREILWVFDRKPEVRPGSTIYVPAKPLSLGFGPDVLLNRALSVTTTLAALLVAISQIRGSG